MPQDATSNVLAGARVALTGRFAALTQRDFADLIQRLGGEHAHIPGRHTKWLVVGSAGPPLGTDGQPTQALRRARQLKADGYPLEIIQEDVFLDQLGLLDDDGIVHQRYTVAQLSRILQVPRDKIRLWIRWGLIEPNETIHRLNFFDYQQVASAKVLCDLVAEGLPLTKIREGLQRVRGWLPGMDSPLGQLSVLEENGRLLVRLHDGRLAEPSGQLQLDFETVAEELSLSIERSEKSTDEWFEEALTCENQGDYRGAAAAYQSAIEQEADDPILYFNLGNVLYASQHLSDAEHAFRQAVAFDEEYLEAWNNLGTVLADLQQHDDAIAAFERAVAVFPLYADAHFNLGDVLAAKGRNQEAEAHWRRYLELDPKSPWADDIRLRLARLEAR